MCIRDRHYSVAPDIFKEKMYVYNEPLNLNAETIVADRALGKKIKTLRRQKGFRLQQLAEMIGSGKSYIWEIENRGLKRPSAEKLALIANALDVTTDFLINNEQSELSGDENKEIFYRKLGRLKQDDQDKIMDMIEAWGKKK